MHVGLCDWEQVGVLRRVNSSRSCSHVKQRLPKWGLPIVMLKSPTISILFVLMHMFIKDVTNCLDKFIFTLSKIKCS